MGAKESILKDVEVGEALPDTSPLHKMWSTVLPGRYCAGERTHVSVFIRDFPETDSEETKKFFENGLQMLKQLRHPSILSYCASSVSRSEVCLVTERVQPLDMVIENLESVEILTGIISLLDALVFLHDRAGLCHNNVCPSAIFVSSDGTWKLGSFECALKLENSRHWVLSDFVKAIKEPVFTPPEDQETRFARKEPGRKFLMTGLWLRCASRSVAIALSSEISSQALTSEASIQQMMKKDVPAHARDSYGFGKVIEFLMPYLEQHLDSSKKECLEDLIEKLTMEEASLRPQLGAISSRDNALSNDLTRINSFLSNIPLKSKADKEAFFRDLVSDLRKLPPIVVGRRLAKNLLSRYVLLEPDAVECLFPSFLEPQYDDNDEEEGGILPLAVYKKHVIPELARIFCVHETSVRLALLTHFHCYVEAFGRATLEKIVLPELLLGMKDTDEEIVSASLRSLAEVVPLLGADTVTGMSHRKYFAEGRPRSEANRLIPEAADLKNVKAALASDSRSAEKYDESERRKEREKKAEERRKFLEQKRKEKNLRLAIVRKNSKHSDEKLTGDIPLEPSASGIIPESLSLTSRTRTLSSESGGMTRPIQVESSREVGGDWPDWEEEEDGGRGRGVEALEEGSRQKKEDTPDIVSSSNLKNGSKNESESLRLGKGGKSPPKSETVSGKIREKKERKSGSASELGAEFDVMSIEVDKEAIRQSEPDYFADMEPVFEKKPLSSLLGGGEVETKGHKSPTKPKNMFQMAVQDNVIDESGGWDEDGWGQD